MTAEPARRLRIMGITLLNNNVGRDSWVNLSAVPASTPAVRGSMFPVTGRRTRREPRR